MQNTADVSRDIVYVLLAFVILSVSAIVVVQQSHQAQRLTARARGMTRDRAAQDAGDPMLESPPPPQAI
jgi:cell division protein FtsL